MEPVERFRVLVGVDGSSPSLGAACWARFLAARMRGEVLLVHVALETSDPPVTEMGPRADAVLGPARALFEGTGIPVVAAQVQGADPSASLVEEARQTGSWLIAVGASSRPQPPPGILGRTARYVLEHSPCPVMVHRGEQACPPSDHPINILLASDGSTSAMDAARFLTMVIAGYGDRVTVVHVTWTPAWPGRALIPPEGLRDPSWVQLLPFEKARPALKEPTRILRAAGATVGTLLRNDWDVARALVGAARERGVDLMVMGARGLSPRLGVLLGSVSLNVARQAPCPVLVVRRSP